MACPGRNEVPASGRGIPAGCVAPPSNARYLDCRACQPGAALRSGHSFDVDSPIAGEVRGGMVMRILTRTVLAVLAVAMTVGVAVDDRLQARQGRGGRPPAAHPPE